MKILLVEDDPDLIDSLRYALGKSGFDITPATSGHAAEGQILANYFDLIILDLGLPDVDGRHLLWKLRSKKNTIPVLILTARDGIDDKVDCLKKGADDYLVKPFDLNELESRIYALIRRSYSNFSKDIVCGRVTLDTREHNVSIDGKPLILFPKEYVLLEMFLLNHGRLLSKEKIAQRLSQENGISDNAIEVGIHRLRKRLKPYDIEIKTFRGLGYMMLDRETFVASR